MNPNGEPKPQMEMKKPIETPQVSERPSQEFDPIKPLGEPVLVSAIGDAFSSGELRTGFASGGTGSGVTEGRQRGSMSFVDLGRQNEDPEMSRKRRNPQAQQEVGHVEEAHDAQAGQELPEQTTPSQEELLRPVQEKVDRLGEKLDQVIEGQQVSSEKMQTALDLIAKQQELIVQQQGEINTLSNRITQLEQQFAEMTGQRAAPASVDTKNGQSRTPEQVADAKLKRQETQINRAKTFEEQYSQLTEEQRSLVDAQLGTLRSFARVNKGLSAISELNAASQEAASQVDPSTETVDPATQSEKYQVTEDLSEANSNRDTAAGGIIGNVATRLNLNLSEEQIKTASARLLERYGQDPKVDVEALLQEITNPPAPEPNNESQTYTSLDGGLTYVTLRGGKPDTKAEGSAPVEENQNNTASPAAPTSTGTHEGITSDGNFYAPARVEQPEPVVPPVVETPPPPAGAEPAVASVESAPVTTTTVEVTSDLIKQYARRVGAPESELLEQFNLGTLDPEWRKKIEAFGSGQSKVEVQPVAEPTTEATSPVEQSESRTETAAEVEPVAAVAEAMASRGIFQRIFRRGEKTTVSAEQTTTATPPTTEDLLKSVIEEQKKQGRWTRRTIVATGVGAVATAFALDHPELIAQIPVLAQQGLDLLPVIGTGISDLIPNITPEQWQAATSFPSTAVRQISDAWMANQKGLADAEGALVNEGWRITGEAANNTIAWFNENIRPNTQAWYDSTELKWDAAQVNMAREAAKIGVALKNAWGEDRISLARIAEFVLALGGYDTIKNAVRGSTAGLRPRPSSQTAPATVEVPVAPGGNTPT